MVARTAPPHPLVDGKIQLLLLTKDIIYEQKLLIILVMILIHLLMLALNKVRMVLMVQPIILGLNTQMRIKLVQHCMILLRATRIWALQLRRLLSRNLITEVTTNGPNLKAKMVQMV